MCYNTVFRLKTFNTFGLFHLLTWKIPQLWIPKELASLILCTFYEILSFKYQKGKLLESEGCNIENKPTTFGNLLMMNPHAEQLKKTGREMWLFPTLTKNVNTTIRILLYVEVVLVNKWLS
jgi:hypothetical protein